jgi:D-alanyl-D-alanine carboxypeptidase
MFALSVTLSSEFFSLQATEPQPLAASVVEAIAAHDAFRDVKLGAKAAIVIDNSTQVVLYVHNPDIQLPLASLTKVPLALVVSEVLAPESYVTIPRDTEYNSKSDQLLAGENWRVKDLLAFMLVSSHNDVAQILSSEADAPLRLRYPHTGDHPVTWRMNNIARNLSLNSMYFLNVTGLDEGASQSGSYGSARDVAELFSYAYLHARDVFSNTASTTITITSAGGRKAHATNTDHILDELSGVVMGKTGTTDLAGGNLAIVFTEGESSYTAVVLGSTEDGRFSDMRSLVRATQSLHTNP